MEQSARYLAEAVIVTVRVQYNARTSLYNTVLASVEGGKSKISKSRRRALQMQSLRFLT